MKRKLLFAAMFIASALGLEVRAQQWQASAPQDRGTYYLYNVGKGGFLIGNDGRGHVALEPIAGQTITLQADGDNFRIDTHALRNNGGTDQWMVENWDDDYVYIDVPYGHNMHMPWKFTEVTGKPGIYYITIVGGTDNGRNLELDSRDKGSKANPVTRSTSSSTNAGAPGFDEWMLVTPEEYKRATELRDDFTSKVATAWNSWTGASGPVGSVTTMTGTTTPLAELYNSSSAGVKMQQSVTGLDNGYYEVRVFASSHNARGEAGASLNGITRDLANVFATSGESTVTKQIVARGVNDGFVGDEQTYPYTMHDVMVKDGTMTIGLNLATAGQTGWHTIQIYSLVKTGDLPLDDKIAAYEAARDAAQAKLSDTGVAPGYLAAIQLTLDTYASVSHTDAAALDEATAALNAVNTKAEESRAPYARYNYLKSLTLAIDDDTSAFTPSTTIIDVSAADAAVAAATTVEGIMNAIPLLRTAALTFVNNVTVTLGKTLDLTVLIANFDFEEEDINMWTAEGTGTWRRMPTGNDAAHYGAEFYHGTRDISQSLTDLPTGSYTASVQVTWRDAQTTGLYLTTAAGTQQTQVEQAYNKGSVEGELEAMNADPAYARITVSNGVTDGTLTFGLKEKAFGDGNCWTLFDNFRLLYVGIDYTPQEEALAQAKQAAADLVIPTAMKTALNLAVNTYTAEDIEAEGTYAEVIQKFNDAIAAINTLTAEASAAVAPYAAYKTLAQAMLDIAEQDVYTGAEDEYNALSAAADDVETVTTVDGFATKETALRSAFAAFLAAADIDNGKYFDLTGLIVNAGLDQGKTGWNGTTPNDFRESCAEFFNMDFDFYQTLPNMPAGNYELHVQAFQRPGSNNVADPAFAAGNNAVNAFIYVNKGQTTILNVMAQTSPTGYFLEGEGVGPKDYKRVTGDLGYVPNGMTGAHRYFEAGFYENTVLTGIEEGDLKFGFKCDGHPTDAWTIFDNFRLYYYGSTIAVSLDEDVAFSTVSDIEHADVILHRTFNDGAWNTLVLPFDMAPQQIDEVFGDNVQVAEYVGTEAKESENMYNLVFSKKTTDGITANVPVMIYGVTKAQDDLYTIEDVTIKVPTSLTKADPEGRIDFVGNYTPGMALQINDFFIASDNNFYKKTEEYNTSVTLKALRGVFRPIDQPDAVKGIGFVVVEDEATGLNEIQSTKDKVPSTVYDLQGRRVATPAKGLYIMDGKKVMLK